MKTLHISLNRSISLAGLVLVSSLSLASCGAGEETANDSAGASATASVDQPVVVTAALIQHGAELYSMNCAPCHGSSGRGDGPASGTLEPKPRDHTNAALMDNLSDKDIAETIKYGGIMKNMPQMPGFPEMKGEDLDALVAFVRSLSRDPQVASAQ